MKIFYGVRLSDSPTFRLLNASTVVAFSGAVRLHIAFLLAGIATNLPIYFAFALIVYATYTLDRTLDSAEDVINNPHLHGADNHAGIATTLAAFSISLSLFVREGVILAPVFPFLVGFLYTKGIRAGSRTIKLKGSCGMKNCIVGLTWGGTIALITSHWCTNTATVIMIFVFYCSKLFVNSVIYDFKDIAGDQEAGIRTLPVYLGEKRTKTVLIVILLILHLLMLGALLAQIIRNEWVIILYSWCIPSIFLLFYSSSFENYQGTLKKRIRELVIDGESTFSLAVRTCAGVSL